MILARCPHCETTFRAEPEALKQRAGKVRCGKCRRVFNALDHLVAEPPAATPAMAPPPFTLTPPPSPLAANAAAGAPPERFALPPDQPGTPTDLPEAPTDRPAVPTEEAASPPDAATVEVHQPGEEPALDEAGDTVEVTAVGHDHAAADAAGSADEAAAPADVALPPPDPLLDGDNGLVAARDSRDIPGYSKWAEDTLSAPPAHFDEGHRSGWLIVLCAIVLGLMLLIQVVHYWRMEIAMRWPDSRPWLEEACRSANCSVPYPRDANLINLEASELQIDPERGNMLVLNLTVKNRAPFAQEFPAIELTLTDSQDNVVVRRILAPGEWLPDLDRSAAPPGALPVSTPPAFPANKEIAARLWIDAQDTGAVGYRVYVFYP
ncbi:MAG TPA: DUF3426 domain-containing protein [Rhodocyclaceae bacterium]|nr:DUF3426 domain-containing protein [Rhodocyclaceae bacterium]